MTEARLTNLTARSASNRTDDWIEWKGGECPVKRSARIKILTRGGEQIGPIPAGFVRWDHRQNPYDIIAYRVVKP